MSSCLCLTLMLHKIFSRLHLSPFFIEGTQTTWHERLVFRFSLIVLLIFNKMITINLFWTGVLQLYKTARELLNVHSWLLHFSPPLPWSSLKQRICEKQLMGAGMARPRNGMLKSQDTEKVVLISKICMDSRINQETEIFLLIPQEESSAPLRLFFIASLRTEDHTSPIHFKIFPVTLVFSQS